MNTKFFYIRNESRFPLACIAVAQYSATDQIKDTIFTWSVWNPNDKFNKKRFREVAEGRLKKVLAAKKRDIRYHSDTGALGTVGEKTGFGEIYREECNKIDILSELYNGSPESFTIVPYSLRKMALAEIQNVQETIIQDYIDDFQRKRIPVSTELCQRDVPKFDVEGRPNGANDSQCAKQVTC